MPVPAAGSGCGAAIEDKVVVMVDVVWASVDDGAALDVDVGKVVGGASEGDASGVGLLRGWRGPGLENFGAPPPQEAKVAVKRDTAQR